MFPPCFTLGPRVSKDGGCWWEVCHLSRSDSVSEYKGETKRFNTAPRPTSRLDMGYSEWGASATRAPEVRAGNLSLQLWSPDPGLVQAQGAVLCPPPLPSFPFPFIPSYTPPRVSLAMSGDIEMSSDDDKPIGPKRARNGQNDKNGHVAPNGHGRTVEESSMSEDDDLPLVRHVSYSFRA